MAAQADQSIGLTSAEAARRLAADGPNELPTARERTWLRQIRDVLREPMLLLLVAAGAINFLLAEPIEGALLMASVLVVVGISLYQEHKTEHALVALRDLSSPRALVIRDGEQQRIAGRDVVTGDVMLLFEGDRVPADALVLDATNLTVDESALTGESVPVRKEGTPAAIVVSAEDGMGPPGGDGTPWVFSGTLVVRGHATAVARHTGARTEFGRIGEALAGIAPERTRLQREIDRLVRVMATIGLGVAALVVVVYGSTRGDWLEGLLAGIAAAMSLLPEEFPVVLAVFLALGAWRMSQRRVLTRRAPVIETLGSTTVLCVDKTGTLTMNTMTVRSFIVDGTVHDIGGIDDIDAASLPDEVRAVAETAALASPIEPFDPMDLAFTTLADRELGDTARHLEGWTLVREHPLSPELLAVTHIWRPPDDGELIVAVKGAPEAVADLCRLDASQRAAMAAEVDRATVHGLRLLGVARAPHPAGVALPDDQRDYAFTFLGLAALHDPVRPGVADAVAECARAGIRTVMITGDYPGTALAIAREVGLDHGGGCITGAELAELDDEALRARVGSISVFARMVPAQKLRLIRALQAEGEVVGMTGDGVNDAPALRAADIGIAMGRRGTDVAREAAALVITDDDFTSIVGGVRQGRGIFDNLRKAMAYIIAVHVPLVGMALFPLVTSDWPLVLLPLQIAILELIIDPACSVVFEAEQVDPLIMDQPPRPVGTPMFDARILGIAVAQGASVLAAVLGVYLWSVLGARPDDDVRSLTFATLVLGNLGLILVNRSWRLAVWRTFRERHNPTVGWILGGALVVLVALLTVPALRDIFGFGAIGLGDAVVVAAAAAAGLTWFEVAKLAGWITPRRTT